MRKLALFVEGYTETIFAERLISEIAGSHNVIIEMKKIRGGKTVPRAWSTINATKIDSGEKYFVLIVDCGGDIQVKTRIIEEHSNLTNKGYEKIIGIRDVKPNFNFDEITKLEQGLNLYIKTSLIPVEFILSVMEIESWFLSEHNHYKEIHESITIEKIIEKLGFNPETDNLSTRENPTLDLDKIYNIGGKSYKKDIAHITVNALDITYVYVELPHRIEYLNRLTDSINQFIC
jgi:hypothetical protein